VPAAPDPADCTPFEWRFPPGWPLQPGDAFDVRPASTVPREQGRLVRDLWFRPLGADTAGRVSPAAVLTYFSDLTFVSALLRPTMRTDITHMTSLDHVLWFHNEARLDGWLYYAKDSPAVGRLRGLAEGRIFHQDGSLIATVAQEGLIHSKRES
jgi:acyl-CoA thioesterase-2